MHLLILIYWWTIKIILINYSAMRKNTCRAFSGPVALLALLFAPTDTRLISSGGNFGTIKSCQSFGSKTFRQSLKVCFCHWISYFIFLQLKFWLTLPAFVFFSAVEKKLPYWPETIWTPFLLFVYWARTKLRCRDQRVIIRSLQSLK